MIGKSFGQVGLDRGGLHAVDAFLDGRIRWSGIAELVERALDQWDGSAADSLDAVLAADAAARVVTVGLLDSEVLS